MTLATTLSGVLPVLPTQTPGFSGVETEEGAIVYDGPAKPSTNFDNGTGSTVTGSITISSFPNTNGVSVSVNFTGLPSESLYGPFVYHIHAFPVPADGNCTATIGHLDPTDRGEYYPCNAAAPATCQVGDLEGKHGHITISSFVAVYDDEFLSSNPASPLSSGIRVRLFIVRMRRGLLALIL
ncbi:hypothetical protein LTR62_001807 [Meristemomyces frigidus]|uniref:Superoxide dismutase copper/zinc binding domain-containing protein n=1 Tax=Meristemomyces frigidus TaxID=1508187 RepID=A0AAN7YI34_9PEZI|nr:hypothetical protein LTR62_001807 [Meristemomyces frigidus]